ncbi:MAG: hypothetical protein ACKVX9_08600 [Blastocatellia bacterium]
MPGINASSASICSAPLARRVSRERGIGRFTFLLSLALAAAIVYLVAMFVPVYMGNQNLEEAATEIVRRGAQQNLSEADVRAQLHEKVREFGLPDDHKIELQREGKGLVANISYIHQIHFPFYTYNRPVVIRVKDLGF